MILEPIIQCECDNCETVEIIDPEYKYMDYSGKNGFYDCDDSSVIDALKELDWSCCEGLLYCPDCTKE